MIWLQLCIQHFEGSPENFTVEQILSIHIWFCIWSMDLSTDNEHSALCSDVGITVIRIKRSEYQYPKTIWTVQSITTIILLFLPSTLMSLCPVPLYVLELKFLSACVNSDSSKIKRVQRKFANLCYNIILLTLSIINTKIFWLVYIYVHSVELAAPRSAPFLINPLKRSADCFIWRPKAYRAVNTFLLGYKNRSVYDVSGTSRCLFSDKYSRPLYLKTQSVPRIKHFSSLL